MCSFTMCSLMLHGVCQRAQALLRSWIRHALDPAEIALPHSQSSQAKVHATKDLATQDRETMGHAPHHVDTDAQSAGQGHKAESGGQGNKDLPLWLGKLVNRVRSRLVASFYAHVASRHKGPYTVRAARIL
jgi:hypothetical protein